MVCRPSAHAYVARSFLVDEEGGLLPSEFAPGGGICFLDFDAWSVMLCTEVWSILKDSVVTLWTVNGIADLEE